MQKRSCFAIYPLILRDNANNGERLPVLMRRETRVPVILANEWIFASRRLTVTASTIIRDLYTVKVGYEWALSKGIDLEERIRSGHGLTPDEISMSFVGALRKGYGRTKVRRLRVSPEHIRVRLCTMQGFLDWGLRRTEARYSLAGNIAGERSVRLARERMVAEFRSAMPAGQTRCNCRMQ